jgi:predicted dithiol-disulfide oxidoreductase (DUF899 family)
MIMATQARSTGSSNVVSHVDWLAARKELLAKEKEFVHLKDDLNRQRRELPRERVEKNYMFAGPNGKESLADVFAGHSQLLVYHFMLGPDWEEGCPSCSMIADSFDGTLPHLNARDVAFVVVSRAPYAQIEAFQKRMGWRFKWVSSYGNEFNRDFGVSFDKDEVEKGTMQYNYVAQKFPREEAPGASAFFKDSNGDILHTYSTYGRGLDGLLNVYNWLDLAPKGRNEEGLSFPMAWVRHHDKYAEAQPARPGDTSASNEKSSCCEHS